MRRLFLAIKAHFLRQSSISDARQHVQASAPVQSPHLAHLDKQLLVDVSVIIQNDAGTGIQRVVRALLLQLLKNPPAGYSVKPVFCTHQHGYHYAPQDFGSPNYRKIAHAKPDKVTPRQGDIFLGLDLCAHLLPKRHPELLHWKTTGVAIHIIVYDLLPVRHPEWFKPKSSQNFHRWLKTIAIFADSAICISNTVKADLNHWLTQQYALSNRLAISTIPLGADLQNSLPSTGLPANIEQQLAQMFQQPAILIVGTLEPRKGHAQVLAAFEKLWQQGHAVNLIIAGKAGWQTEDLQHQLSNHPNPSLHWLANASDELLEQLYIRCSGVIVASYAEGFGLPLREAMHYQKPIFARDIPVFREIGDQGIAYFDAHNTEKMHIELAHWLSQIDQAPIIYQTMNETWHDSASALLTNLGLNRP